MTSKRVGKLSPVALDCRTRTVQNPNTRIQEEVPELDPVWVEDVQFVAYSAPPLQFEGKSPVITDQASLEEWTENMTFMSEDLKRLLSLPHSKFWCQVIFDETLQQCLDSYLRFASRDFDLWSSLPSQVSELSVTVHQRVFMTYLRMSTHKESKEDFLTPGTFGDILYENFLFDIPKLLDICALYGGEQSKNTPLLRKMMDNIFSKQPKYHDDLNATIPTIYETLDNIMVKCGLQQDTDNALYAPERLDDPSKTTQLTAQHLQDIVLYLTDTFQTLVAFLHTLPSLCSSFQQQSFVPRVAGFFDFFAPILEASVASEIRAVRRMWRGTKVSLLKLCHLVLQTCCIAPLTSSDFSRGHEQLQNCVEEYLEVFTSILSYKRFLSAYNVRFSIHTDLMEIERSPATLDETRAEFIMTAVDGACEAFPSQLGKRRMKRNHIKCNMTASTSASSSPRQNGPVSLNKTVNSEEAVAAAKTVDDVELVSMVTHIRDILPDLGEGFLIKCLVELNYDVERVISSILEDSLPTSLQSLSKDLSKEDVMKARKQDEMNGILADRHSVYDRDEFDVFSHNGLDCSKIQKGKRHDRTNLKSLLADRSDMTESVKERYSNYDVYGKLGGEQDFQDVCDMYDDEYDDTYDTQNVGAMDADPTDQLDELKFRRPFTTPRVLGGSPQESSEEEEENEGEQTNSQQDKQGESQDVCSTHRGTGHGRGAKDNKTNHKTKRDVRGRGRGQGVAPEVLRNRAFKEKHKASRSNHNRKAGADRKRNKGMGALPPQ